MHGRCGHDDGLEVVILLDEEDNLAEGVVLPLVDGYEVATDDLGVLWATSKISSRQYNFDEVALY